MALFKVNRGKSENLPQERHNGWAYFCTDTAEFFIDYEDDSGIIQRKQLNAAEASRLIGYDVVNEINESSEVEIPTAKAILGHLGKYVSLPDRGAIIQLSEALLAALPELADGQQHTIEFTPDEEDTSEILEFQIQSAVQQHNTAVETHTDIRQEIISAKETLTTYVDEKIASIPTPDVSGQIKTHNEDGIAHADIRETLNNHTHSWNDLEDKPFGEEVVSQRTVWHEISATATSTTLQLKNSKNISECEKKNVIVTLNDVEYESICLFEDSGEYTISFGGYKILQAVAEMPYAILTPVVNGETYNVKIEVVEEVSTVTPIDGKYLPNGIAYTTYVDEQVATKANSEHDHNDLYYTESEIDEIVSNVGEILNSHTHSWNDLNDKPFGEETSAITIFSGNVDMVGQDIGGVYFTSAYIPTGLSSIPEEVTVTVDGVSTVVKVNEGGFTYNERNVKIGTAKDDNGNWTVLEFIHGGNSNYTIEDITIEAVAAVVKTIDSKYLPEVYATQEYVDGKIESKLESKSDSDHNHDSAYDTKGAADTALDSAKAYTNELVNDHIPRITKRTLSASSWDATTLTQTVTVNGILGDETKQIINVTPYSSNITAAGDAGIYCSSQADNQLTFTCKTIPTDNIIMVITWQNAQWVD